jgi:hypothetical protein
MNYEQKYNKYKYKYLEMLKNVKKYGSGGDDDKPASLPNASNIVSSNESVPKEDDGTSFLLTSKKRTLKRTLSH